MSQLTAEELMEQLGTPEAMPPENPDTSVGKPSQWDTIGMELDGDSDLDAQYLQQSAERERKNLMNEFYRDNAMTPIEQGYDTMLGLTEGQAPAVEEPGTVEKIAKDVGQGIWETPRAIVSGAIDAGNEFMQTIYDFGNELRDMGIGPDGYLKIGADGISWEKGKIPDELQIQAPNFEAPESTTGKVIHDISQFMTGFLATSKVKPLQSVAAASKGGKIAAGAAAGFGADYAFMDDQQKRVSEMFKGTPLENDVTNWLAEKGDSDLDNRLKNGLEGLGLGAATDAVFKGMKLTRDWMRAKAGAPKKAAENYTPGVDEDAMRQLGDPDKPLVEIPELTFGEAAEKKIGDAEKLTESVTKSGFRNTSEKIKINFSRIDTPDDVKNVMDVMAQAFRDDINKERRGVMTFENIADAAAAEDAWKILLQRRTGDAMNAEQTIAARTLWASSADSLAKIAEATAKNPSRENQFLFQKMIGVHHMIQKEVLGMRAEAGRALVSWKMPIGTSEEKARIISDAIKTDTATTASTQMMAQKLTALLKSGMVKEADSFLNKSIYAKTSDAIQEAWINGLLSNWKTHEVNVLSNTVVMGYAIAERALGSAIGRALGTKGASDLSEASAMITGAFGGVRDAFRNAYKSFVTEKSGYGFGKIDEAPVGSISSQRLGLNPNSFFAKGIDLLGTAVRLPGRALQSEDEFFKTLNYRMEIHASAHRQAVAEAANGKIPKENVSKRYEELVNDPTPGMMMNAKDFAQYQTFTNVQGDTMRAFNRIVNNNLALKILMPFVRTPANILSFSLERSPFAVLSSRFHQEMAAGGHRANLAMAKVSLGTMTMLAGLDLAANGIICGNGPRETGARQMHQREWGGNYRMRLGNESIQYNRLDPLGFQLGMAADIWDTINNLTSDREQRSVEQVLIGSIFAISNNLLDKTYLMNISGLVEALSQQDFKAQAFVNRIAGSVIPASVAQVTRLQDPYMREARRSLDAIMARVPGLSETLPPRRDLWGRAILNYSGKGFAYDAFSPIAASEYGLQPIDEEMQRLEYYPTTVGYKVPFNSSTGDASAEMDLEDYPGSHSRYAELAGNSLKMAKYENKGCMDFLNEVVTGKSPYSEFYRTLSEGPDGEKVAFIRSVISDFRNASRLQLAKEFPEMQPLIDYKIQKMRDLKLPME